MNCTQRGKFCRLASVTGYKKKQVGFTLFELVGIIFVASVLALVLFDRLLFYQTQAEKTVMEMTVINMRSGLRLRVAELMMQNRMNEVGSLVHENPMNWLAAAPSNYIGTFQNPEQRVIPTNTWYFDATRRELVYTLGHDHILGAEPTHERVMRFRVTAIEHPLIKGGGAMPKVDGVMLVSVARQDSL
jgi:general secretion pathway protein G